MNHHSGEGRGLWIRNRRLRALPRESARFVANHRRRAHSSSPLVPACAGTTAGGHRSGPVAPHALVIPANAGIGSAPGYEPMCAPGKACGRAVCGLAAVKRAPKLKRCTGTGLRRYDGWGTDQARWRLIRSSFRRTPESDRRLDMNQCALRARPRGRAVCGLATVERASKLTPHWVPAFAGTTK